MWSEREGGDKGARGRREERVSVLSSSRIHRVLVFTRPVFEIASSCTTQSLCLLVKTPDLQPVQQAFEGVVKGAGGNQDARGKITDRVSFPSSSRGHRVHAHLSYSSFSYPFKLLPHSLAHLPHCLVFRFYWLKVRSLAESHNWLELDKFSKARKSLIGYEVSSLTIYVFRYTRAMC